MKETFVWCRCCWKKRFYKSIRITISADQQPILCSECRICGDLRQVVLDNDKKIKEKIKDVTQHQINHEVWFQAIRNDDVAVIKFLIKHGVDLHASFSPLHIAVAEHRIDIIKILLKAGGNVHFRRNGSTLLHDAARCEYPDMIQFLISEGCDVAAKQDEKITALNIISNIYPCGELGRRRLNKCIKILILHMVLQDCVESDYYRSNTREYLVGRMMAFRDRCQTELEAMKKEKIIEGVTLYDIIKSKCIISWIQKKKVRSILQEKDYGRQYSENYANILEIKFKRGLKRLNALKVGEIVISHFDSLMMIRDLGYHLTKYLSNYDIQNLREAAIQTMEDESLCSPSAKKKRMTDN